MAHALARADAADMSDPQEVLRCGMAGAKLGAVALATLVIGLAACGDDGGDETTAPRSGEREARAGAANLSRYLMRKDEEPGFRPGAAPGAMPCIARDHHGRQGVREGDAPAAGRRAATSPRGVHLVHRPADPRPADGRGHERRPVRDRGRRPAQPGARVAPGRHPRGWPRRKPPVLPVPGVPGARGWTASLRRAGEPRRRQRLLGAGPVHARPRKPGPRSLRRPAVGGRAGDL